MRALQAVAGFELRHHLRRISTWVYFTIFFAIAFGMTASFAGAWRGFDQGNDLLFANSPRRIAALILSMTVLSVPVTAALAGTAVYRDFESRAYPLFFTTPVSRLTYLGGRYLGSLAASCIVFLSVPLGIVVACAMPFVEAGRVGPFRPAAYLHALGLLALPTLLITCALFLVLGAVTRRMLSVYVGAFALVVGWALGLVFAATFDSDWAIYMVDPFGLAPTLRSTRYWTVVEQNRSLLPLAPLLLANRALWLTAGAAVFAWGAHRFRFAHLAGRRDAERPASSRYTRDEGQVAMPRATRRFDGRAHALQFAATLTRSLREMLGSVYFWILMAICVGFVLLLGGDVGEIYGTRTYPVTYKVLDTTSGTFALFLIIIITFYAGELVWMERDSRTHQLHDAAPVPTWVPLAAKLCALSTLVAALLAACMACGILIQLSRGYYQLELGVYLRELFVHQWLGSYLPLVVLAFAMQTLANHKYVGHFGMLLYYVGGPTVYSLGVQHNLLVYASSPTLQYSDMNRWTGAEVPWAWFTLFWLAVATLLVVLCNLFWTRGEERGRGWRMRLARLRATRPVLVAASVAGALMLGTGGFILYNTVVLNPLHTDRDSERVQAEYERRYKRFEWAPQPRVTGVKLHVELFPRAQEMRTRGTYTLRNRTRSRIDSVHVDVSSDMKIHRFAFDRPARRVVRDSAGGYYVFALARPMLPGDSATFTFDVALLTPGFANEPHYGPV
ncbi:MAG TPA: ABC transporter permease, partial [Longimicrobium sp.]